MERKMYALTEKQMAKCNTTFAEIMANLPSDDEFKTIWKKAHGGKVAGWGMKKRDYILGLMVQTQEYQLGLWQGRVDKARGLDYSEERNENAYNLGYYRGYTEYESNRKGWDRATRERFDAEWVNE